MKKQTFYQLTFGRMNVLKYWVLTFFFGLSSYPRLLLEVFIRKNFGVRYFSLMSAATVFVPLAAIPIMLIYGYRGPTFGEFVAKYITWYAYLAAFAYFCFQRQKEVKREPGVFDFAKFSQYGGDKDDRFFEIKVFGKEANHRTVATLLEPGLFLALAIGLLILRQPIGYVIGACSIFYSLGYFGAYHLGDIYMMDVIDQIIVSEELANVIVEGRKPQEARGFEMFGQVPHAHEFRKKVVDFLKDEDEVLEVI
jgi:hypothetical protein